MEDKSLRIQEIYKIVQDNFILPVDSTDDSNRMRKIRRVIEGVYASKGIKKKSAQERITLSKADAERLVLYNPDIRAYFLRLMENSEGTRAYFARLDEQANQDSEAFAARMAEMGEAERARFDDINWVEMEQQEMRAFLLEALHRTTTTQDLCEQNGIDYDRFKEAFHQREDLRRGDEPHPIRDGFSEINYKLRRPTIYFHK